MKYLKIILSLSLFCVLSCSHYFENKLKIINQSNDDVYYDFAFHSELNPYDLTNYQGNTLKVGDSVRPPRRDYWENDIKKFSKDSSLTIYFIKANLFKTKTWEEIYKNQEFKISKYKIKDLDSMK